MTTLTTNDGDQLPDGTRVSGYHCLDCDHTDADAGPGEVECGWCLSGSIEQIVVSDEPLIGDKSIDDDYYHFGMKAYLYTVEED